MKRKIIIPLIVITTMLSCKQSASDKGRELGKDYCEISNEFKNVSITSSDSQLQNKFTKKFNELLEKQKKIQGELNLTDATEFLAAYAQEVSKCSNK
jgi:hypothetical protein